MRERAVRTRREPLGARRCTRKYIEHGKQAQRSHGGRIACCGRQGGEKCRPDRLAVAPGSTYEGKILARIASLPCEEKSGEKNRGGDITPIRLRRSLFFVAPATPAGPAAVCPVPPSGPRLPRPRRVRPVEPSCTRCAGAAGGRASAQAHRWRVLVANQVSEWPFSSPWVRKGRTTKNRRPDRRVVCNITDSQLTTAHYCAALRGIARYCAAKNIALSKCPRTVRRSRSASRRAPLAAAPVALRLLPLRLTQNEPMPRKGNVLYCVDMYHVEVGRPLGHHIYGEAPGGGWPQPGWEILDGLSTSR